MERILRIINWTVWAIVALLIVIGGLTFNGYADAAEITQEQANEAYVLAYGLVAKKLGLPSLMEIPTPTVEFVPHDRICELLGIDAPCQNYRAISREDYVWVADDNDFSSPAEMTIMLHEFVHYFQYVAWGPITGWCDNYRREVMAYETQLTVLMKIDNSETWQRSVHQTRAEYMMRQYRAHCS